jgi:uncharacterized cupin superfamily protein
MPKIDIKAATPRAGCSYPTPFDEPCNLRVRRQLGDVAGLTQFGVNMLRLPPGSWSSQRHWHQAEDEFVWVLQGEVVLVSDEGEQLLHPGDCAGFAAGVANGHHLQNRSNADAIVLEVGTRRPEDDGCVYPDIDLIAPPGSPDYTHRDGSPYPSREK